MFCNFFIFLLYNVFFIDKLTRTLYNISVNKSYGSK